MSGIQIEQISRHFNDNIALKEVNLEIQEGEFFSLLGPSGCGKTTLLNIIAGFLDPTAGTVYIGDKDVTGLPPYKRHLGMVFQNYALFPHLTVFENVAYGLKVQKVGRGELKDRVMESLQLVRLESFAERMPHQLSGGQQQRVAIARALAIRPSVLLMDEPLSNLDAKLRKEMQFELRKIQKDVGITTVLVTHDQEEALSLSDRVGILGDGELQQIGAPLEVYRRPANRFVAEFIGQVNLIEAKLAADYTEGQPIRLEAPHYKDENNNTMEMVASAEIKDIKSGQSALCMIRPERIHVSTSAITGYDNIQKVTVKDASYIGNAIRLQVLLGQGEMIVHAPDPVFQHLPSAGDTLYIAWHAEDLIYLETKEL